MTMRLEIGMQVRVRTKQEMLLAGFRLTQHNDFDVSCGMVEDMYESYGGMVTTIVDVWDNDRQCSISIDHGEYTWSIEMFEMTSITAAIPTTKHEYIELEFCQKMYGDFEFKIVKCERTTDFDIHFGGIWFQHRSSPEIDGSSFYLWGTNTQKDCRKISCSSYRMFNVLTAIHLRHENQAGEGLPIPEWMDAFKFTCVECDTEMPFSMMGYNHICKCCEISLVPCMCCGNLTRHMMGPVYVCKGCSNIGTCQVCGTKNIARVYREFQIPEDYHGENKRVYNCLECNDKELVFGREHHYHYVPEKFYLNDVDKKTNKRTWETDIKKTKKKLFMGIEIESAFKGWTHTNLIIGDIQSVYGKNKERILYAKHDGTVPTPGSELVTHPMSLDFVKSLTWEGLYRNVVNPEGNKGIGGHIHINKTSFYSLLHSYRFIKFINTNHQYIEFIGERTLNEWCKKGRIATTSKVKNLHTYRNSDRYELINFTTNTIELRFFWTPWNVNMLYKNAEFVHALWSYTINSALHFGYKDFEAYVEKEMVQYPYLYNFIRGRVNCYQPNEEQKNPPYSQQGASYDDCDGDVECSNCGCEGPSYDMAHIDGAYYCDECSAYCDWCDERHTRDSYTVRDSSNYRIYVCQTCYDEDFATCHHCDTARPDEQMQYLDVDGNYYCLGCLEGGNTPFHYCDTCNEWVRDCDCADEEEVEEDEVD